MKSIAPSSGQRAPRALIVLLSPGWAGIARLPRALASSGWQVASLCPAGTFLALTRFNQFCEHLSSSQNSLHELNNLVERWDPDWLIPGCDSAVDWLQQMVHVAAQGRWPAQASRLLNLVNRSLGHLEPHQSRLSKHENIARATRLGIPTPKQFQYLNSSDALAQANQMGWPVVLKADTGAAGLTVRVCHDAHSLQLGWAELIKLKQQPPALQEYLPGMVAMCAGVAVDGVLLDSVNALKLKTYPGPTSPCSVHRHYHDPAMADALARLVQDLRFTGFCAADFIIDTQTRTAHFIELNPRPTPLTAQAGLYGHDLTAAWIRHLDSEPQVGPTVTRADTVALFPSEWARDPNSPYLTEAFHDVPDDDPALLQALQASVGFRADCDVRAKLP